MTGGIGALWKALRATSSPIVAVRYEHLAARDRLLGLCQEMLAPTPTKKSTAHADAFDAPDVALLLTPTDELAAILALERRREQLLSRTAPLVLFLLRGGAGEEALKDAPGLGSWIGGDLVDPDGLERVDVHSERLRFEAETGTSPEAWLRSYASGEIPDTEEAMIRLHHAKLLERSS